MENKKLILKHPIPIKTDGGGEAHIKDITFGRMKVKHLKLLPKNIQEKTKSGNLDAAEMIPLIAALAGLEEKIADEIDIEDLEGLAEALGNAVGKLDSTKIGQNLSTK